VRDFLARDSDDEKLDKKFSMKVELIADVPGSQMLLGQRFAFVDSF